ncbi:MAG: DNA mismatch repair endonuclease MutL, partial [Geobacteraceae bacterium]|nr:DNA mismatch repair endonuclease MutL [Geobacteraceae bacterium]
MSARIKILPENLTNKIAAGEVVERPASVVKELVENAIDAGASEVTVEIEAGGKRLIRVSDNGSGMTREDALLSLERHATSKIATDGDLFHLATLGFRGEALPSIASVSRFTLATREEGRIEGTEIYAEGGRIREVKACGMARGTVVAVRNLFFNTPARLKFLKSTETETGHVGEFLARLAISRPEVRFTYLSEGRTVFRALDGDLRERAASLLGAALAADLYPMEFAAQGISVSGLVAPPGCSRSAASHLYTYINGRFIRDRVVQHAILQAYRNFMERGRYPVVVLFIRVPPGEVDVNVHPTKHEVRFREQGRVHDAIQAAVESVLRETPWIRRAPAPSPPPPPSASAVRVAEVREALVEFGVRNAQKEFGVRNAECGMKDPELRRSYS